MGRLGQVLLQDPVNWQHPLNAGLRLWLAFPPGCSRGNRLRDLCGRNHGALSSGAVHRGGGIAFPSTSNASRVELSDAGLTFPLSAATVSVWFRTHSDWGGNYPAVFYCRPSSGNANSFGFSRKTDGGSPSSLSYYLCDSAGNFWGGSYVSLYSSEELATNSLYHAVMAWDAAAPRVVGYLNGKEQFTNTGTARTPSSYAGRFYVGNDPWVTTRSGRCTVYSARVWGRYLSAPEVAAVYADDIAGSPDLLRRVRPVAYFVPSDTPPPPSDDYHVVRYTQADLHRAVGSGVY